MKNVFKINADIKGAKMATSPFITQNDAVSFEVSLFDGDKEIDLSGVTTSTLASTRGDKVTVLVEGEKTGVNKVTFNIGTAETKLTGEVNAVVQLYGEDGRVSTVRFVYKVTSDPVGDGFIPSEREKTLIEVVLGDGPLIIAQALEAAAYVEERKPVLEEAIGLAEQILDESFETGALDTNIKQRLTDLETQYTPKLTSVETQLAEKAKWSEVNALIGNLADATPLFADNISGMTDTTKLYVNLGDGYLHAYKNGSWVSTGVKYQEKGIGRNSIGLDKLSFAEVSKNLFTGAYRDGLLVGVANNRLEMRTNYSTFKGKTAVIKVEKGTTYTVKIHDPDKSNILRIALHNSNPVFAVSGSVSDTTVFSNSVGGIEKEYTFTTGAQTEYALIYVSNNAQEPRLQLEEGSVPTEYVAHKPSYIPRANIEPLRAGEITPSQTNFFEFSGNLFNGEYKTNLVLYGVSEALPSVNKTASEVYSGIIEIKEGKTYTVTKYEGGNRFVVMALPTYPTDAVLPLKSLYYHRGKDNGERQTHTFTNTSGATHLYVCTSYQSSEKPNLQIEEGVESNDFRPPLYIPSKYLEEAPSGGGESSEGVVVKKDYSYNFYTPLNTLYKKTDVIPNYITSPLNLTVDAYHTMFNDLVAEHGGISTSESLGNATGDYPLYKYELVPPSYKLGMNSTGTLDGSPMKTPKIVMTTGIHGHERSPSISAYYFFKEVLENPENNELLEFIKMNVHFICVPLVNPSGWTDATYENRNGMNLNRDFPPLGKATQAESKLVKSVLDTNADMDFFIDFHNMYFRDGYIGYTLTDNEIFKNTMNILYRNIGREWQKKYSALPQKINHVWGYNARPNNGTIANYTETQLAIPSTLMEIIRSNDWLGGGDSREPVARMGIEFIVNAVIGALRTKF